jgi:PncC family amidohydrolase
LSSDWIELLDLCRKKGITLSTAESCTGGYISSCITDIPGSSDSYIGGVIVYSNELKQTLLGVKEETLEEYGAVSRECAAEMVSGLFVLVDPDISLSVTGIAGPGGGSPEKPVGTVFIGVGTREGPIEVEGFLLEGMERKAFKEEVAQRALGMLLGHATIYSK